VSAHAITLRCPADLHPHELNRRMPRWQPDSDEWLAFLADVKEHGVQVPLRITAHNEVVDGETRRLAAKQIGIASVPCVVVPPDEEAATVIREIQHRRNLTKGQRAYLIAPALAYLADARERQVLGLRKGQAPGTPSVFNPDLYARSLGFSRDLLEQAQRLHAEFEHDEELRAEFEPRILDFEEPIGLGACLAGIAGRKATLDKPRSYRADERLHLFKEAWGVLGKRFNYWEKLGDEDRREVVPILRQTVASMPVDLRAELKRALTAAEREQN
jgi:hypothetical protein